jgi:hypothetical protein
VNFSGEFNVFPRTIYCFYNFEAMSQSDSNPDFFPSTSGDLAVSWEGRGSEQGELSGESRACEKSALSDFSNYACGIIIKTVIFKIQTS